MPMFAGGCLFGWSEATPATASRWGFATAATSAIAANSRWGGKNEPLSSMELELEASMIERQFLSLNETPRIVEMRKIALRLLFNDGVQAAA